MPAVPSIMTQQGAHSEGASLKSFVLPPTDTIGGQTCWVPLSGNTASSIGALDESTLTCPNIPAWVDKATQNHPPPLTISIHPGDQDMLGRDEAFHKEHVDNVSAQSIESQQDRHKPEEEPHEVENAASRLILSILPTQLEQVIELLKEHRIDFQFDDDTPEEQREDSESKSWASIALMTTPFIAVLIGFTSGRIWEQSCKTISFEEFQDLDLTEREGLTARILNLPQALRLFIQEQYGRPLDQGNFQGYGRRLGEVGRDDRAPYYSYRYYS